MAIQNALNLTATGMISATGAGVYNGRTITGTTDQISISNGDGVSGNPTISTPQNIASTSSPTFSSLTLTNPLTAANGGTGASSLTDGGVLVGSGVGAITALAAGTNGQLLIGSTGVDPVFGTVTSSNGSITLATGAGTIGFTVTQAGEAQVGGAEIATQAEVTTGTDDARYITPLKYVTSLASPPAIGLTSSAASAFTTVGVGTTTVPHGGVGVGKLALDGTDASSAGPHIQVTTSSDNYPVFQMRNYSHDNIGLYFDAYWDGTNVRSSDVGSNFALLKNSDNLRFIGSSGNSQGSIFSFTTLSTLYSSGITRLHLQPAFVAYSSSSQTNVTGTAGAGFIKVIFGTELLDQASNFASSTFTVPTNGDGLYALDTTVYFGGITVVATQILVRFITSNETIEYQNGNVRDSLGNVHLSNSAATYMDAGDTAIVEARVIGEASDVVDINTSGTSTRFSGYKAV